MGNVGENTYCWYVDFQALIKTMTNCLLITLNLPEKRNTGVQISQCVGMTPTDCLALAQGLADAHPEWFPQENVPVLVANERELHQKIRYYHVGIPTSNGKVANNCKSICCLFVSFEFEHKPCTSPSLLL